MTGTRKVEGHVIDIVVMSMDNKVSEELTNVRTVEQIPVYPLAFHERTTFRIDLI